MSALFEEVPVVRFGREKTNHRARVVIVDGAVRVRTQCGLDLGDRGTTGTGFPTCTACEEAES